MQHTELSGVIVPVITPVNEQDQVDELAFRLCLRRLIEAGVHGLFVGGSAGEGPLLVEREWRRMVEIAFDEVKDALPLLGGAIDTSTQRVKEKIRVLADIGFKYLVVTPTYYYTLRTPGEHLRLFTECADASAGLTMIAYNIPSCTHSQIPIEVLREITRRGLVKYCKESSGDLAYFQRVMAEVAPLGLNVFMGDESGIAAGLRAGACGIVPVCANYDPATFLQAYRAGTSGTQEESAQAQDRVMCLRKNLVLAGPSWIVGLKYALSLKGIGSGKAMSPLQPLTDLEKQNVATFHATWR
jgi:4-hydroxy-tetrahydrodipicolinate synthase